jgi:mRNA-degrading endonuclease toxin of MazEF toxin-antitoxin module
MGLSRGDVHWVSLELTNPEDPYDMTELAHRAVILRTVLVNETSVPVALIQKRKDAKTRSFEVAFTPGEDALLDLPEESILDGRYIYTVKVYEVESTERLGFLSGDRMDDISLAIMDGLALGE